MYSSVIVFYLYTVTCILVAGVADIPLLDAPQRAPRLGRADAYDHALRETATNLHTRSPHEESRLRTLPRIQGDFTGQTINKINKTTIMSLNLVAINNKHAYIHL